MNSWIMQYVIFWSNKNMNMDNIVALADDFLKDYPWYVNHLQFPDYIDNMSEKRTVTLVIIHTMIEYDPAFYYYHLTKQLISCH